MGEAEGVPAEGSGAPGGVKRRAVGALTELKWAGKPGADCLRHAQDLPPILRGGGERRLRRAETSSLL